MVQSKFLLKFKEVKHCFFDRLDSLNLERYNTRVSRYMSSRGSDSDRGDPESSSGLLRRRKLLLAMTQGSFCETCNNIKPNSYISAEQVHGNRVVVVTNDKHKYIKNCDGMVTKEALFLGISTADCLPIFFYDPKKTIIAAIHAGWKGLYLGIIQNAIKKMKKLGSQPKDIIVAMGPHIKVCCYNVSLRRVEMFKRRKNNFFPDIGIFRNFLWYLNLEKIAQQQMADIGILKRNIDILPFCTSCDKRFFSVRRDGVTSSRMFNVIGLTT